MNYGFDYQEKVKTRMLSYLQDDRIVDFFYNSLKLSLAQIGFSERFICELKPILRNLDIVPFIESHLVELKKVFENDYYTKIVPLAFENYFFDKIPYHVDKVLDVGCGTGILLKRLSKYRDFDKLIGIDINEYPQWSFLRESNLDFQVVGEKNFFNFLKRNRFDLIFITVTLHHIEYEKQQEYLENLYQVLDKGSLVIVLEDSFSEVIKPEFGLDLYEKFMSFSNRDKLKIMSLYDWFANRVLARREEIPFPFCYRTLEDWELNFKKIGFEVIYKKFIGFPNQRDVNTPQSILIVKK